LTKQPSPASAQVLVEQLQPTHSPSAPAATEQPSSAITQPDSGVTPLNPAEVLVKQLQPKSSERSERVLSEIAVFIQDKNNIPSLIEAGLVRASLTY